MNDRLDDATQGQTNEDRVAPPAQGDARARAEPEPKAWRSRLPIIFAATAIILIATIAAWLLWPQRSGKSVPAPRSVSFEESPAQETASTGDQKLVLSADQVQRAGLKIETVGEQPTFVQANSYKETPVVSLVGGIVRSVRGELGQNVKRGQTIAVVFSNELADAQSRYLTALAALDEHHRHHLRTIKLVEIGAASRQDLEMAMSQYREAESNVANLRQKLLLLGMTPQRMDALNSTAQISSDVTVTAPATGTLTSRRRGDRGQQRADARD